MKRNRPIQISQFIASVFAASIVFVQAGCAGVQVEESSKAKVDIQEIVFCPEPRPEVCTQEYRVVCAMIKDGSFREYPNGCTSCADPDVVGYREGHCGLEG